MRCSLCAAIVVCALTACVPPARGQTLTTVPRPGEADLLAEPTKRIDIVIGYVRGEKTDKPQEEKGTLCCLRIQEICYRDEKGKFWRLEAKGGRVKWIETADHKYRWDLDEKAQVFKGSPGPIEVINLNPQPATREREVAFLYAAIEQLYRDLETVEWRDEEGSKILDAAARRYADRASELRQTRLADLCAGFTELSEQRRARDKAVADVWKEQAGKESELWRDWGVRRRQAQLDALSELSADSLLALLITGLQASAQAESDTLQADLDLLKSFDKLTDESRTRTRKELQGYECARCEPWKKLFDVGHDDFKRPQAGEMENRERVRDALKKGNLEDLRKFYRDAGDKDKDNPFLRVEACRVECCLRAAAAGKGPPDKKLEHAEKILALARECVDAVRQVPKDQAYEWVRLELLARACLIACTAAEVELAGEGWGKNYSHAAAYAVRLIDCYNEAPNHYELTGLLREYRAWALLQSGRPEEALEQARNVPQHRQDKPRYGVNLARAYCCCEGKDNTRKAMDALERAVKVGGFADIRELRTNPDFERVRFAETARFKALTALEHVSSRDGNDLLLTNKSAYSWTRVKVTLTVSTANGAKTVQAPQLFSCVAPEEKVRVKDLFKDVGPIAPGMGAVVVDCDQKK
jgi:hypothetical protein